MNDHIRVEARRVIDAPVEQIYRIIADYRDGHQAILPRPYFKRLEILQGGYGAGTEYKLTMEVYGQQTHYHHIVSEPVPGRVLREQDTLTSQYSQFTLEPVSAQQTQVTIFSEMPLSRGIKGMLERWFQPGIVRRLFDQQLNNLAAYVQNHPA